MLKTNKMQENKRKGQPKWQKLPKGQNSEGTYSEGTEKEGEEKNSSSTQAKWRRREKSSLTTQENFWCVLKCGMRALFIGEEVDENGNVV